MSLVLQMTDLSRLPQVPGRHRSGAPRQGFAAARDRSTARAVLAAYARIAPLGWTVFVEQPRAAALAPLLPTRSSAARGCCSSRSHWRVAAGVLAARRLVAPIGELRRGAQRFGAGDLAHRIERRQRRRVAGTRRPLQLDGASSLSEMYANLERRVAERTRELNERTRQLADANQAKSRFLAAASHDLRQPMHALTLFVGQLQRLQARRDRTARANAAHRARRSGSSASCSISCSTSRSSTPARCRRCRRTSRLRDVLAAIEAQFAPLARAKGIELRVRRADAWLRSDPVLVQRILLNLVAQCDPLHRSAAAC